MVVESVQVLEVAVGGYVVNIQEDIHMFGDNDLLIAKLVMENLNCLLVVRRRKSKSCDIIRSFVTKQRVQVVELLDFRKPCIQVDC